MKNKIQKKISSARKWKYATIAVPFLWVAIFAVLKLIDLAANVSESVINAALVIMGIVTIACVVVYFGFRRNILRCMKIFEEAGVSLDEVANDLDNAQTIGKVRKIKYGNELFTIPSPFCVFAYKEILWVYVKKTTTMDTGTGASSTKKEVIFCTAHGKKFTTSVSWKTVKELIEQNRDKFLPGLILGYKMKYNKQYKEMVKQFK